MSAMPFGPLLGIAATQCVPTAGCCGGHHLVSQVAPPRGGAGEACCLSDRVFAPQPAGYWTCSI